MKVSKNKNKNTAAFWGEKKIPQTMAMCSSSSRDHMPACLMKLANKTSHLDVVFFNVLVQ